MTRKVRDFQKAQQRANILEKIRTAGLLSRVDLARQTGLSKASVTGLISVLIDEGLILEEKVGIYEGGRRPILLGINPTGAYAIGVNVSLQQIRIVIINFHAEVQTDYVLHLSKDHYEPEEIIDKTAQAIQACLWESNFSREQISGVGIGLPGLVDLETGTIRYLPNYGWSNVPFRQMLEEKIGHPVYIDNDSNTLAIAEHWYGEGKGVDNFLVVTLQNGVGCGTVVHGRLLRGSFGIASEFGHMCIDPAGPLCRCGRKGCVEAWVGNTSILREAKNIIKEGKWKTRLSPSTPLKFDQILEELQRGNEDLARVYQQAGKVLGIGIRNLITLFNPELIILTGKGIWAGDALSEPMYASMEQLRSGKFGSYKTKLLFNDWTEEDWARGAGTLVLQEIYKSPRMQ